MMSKRKQITLDNFFGSEAKARRVDAVTEDRNNESYSVSSDSSALTNSEIVHDSLASIEECSPKPNTNIENISTFYENDIGSYIDRLEKLDDRTRYQLLQNPWIPTSNYSFPYSVHKKHGRDE